MKNDQIRVSDAINSSIGLIKAFSSCDVATAAIEELKFVLETCQAMQKALEISDKGWRDMSTAPDDGKHCLLVVKEGAFFYVVQGKLRNGKWSAVHRDDVKPICWMPNIRIPQEFLAPYLSAGEE